MSNDYRPVMVDLEEAKRLLDEYNRNGLLTNIRSFLQTAIFSDCFSIWKKGTKKVGRKRKRDKEEKEEEEAEQEEDVELTDPFYLEYFHKYYKLLEARALEYLIPLGYFVYRVLPVQDAYFDFKLMNMPIIVPRENYNLVQRIYHDGHTEWVIFNIAGGKNSQNPDPTMQVFFMPGCQPDSITGQHRSYISALMEHGRYVSDLYRLHLEAVAQAAKPTYAIEANQNGNSSLLATTVVPTTDSALLSAQKQDKADKMVTNKLLADAVRLVRSVHHSVPSRGERLYHSDPFGGDGAGESFGDSTDDDALFLIPPDYKSAGSQPAIPQPQKDVLTFSAEWKEQVVSTFGIPVAFLLGSSKNSAKQNTNNASENDVEQWQRRHWAYLSMMNDAAEAMYLLCFPELQGHSNLEFFLISFSYLTSGAIQRLYEQSVIHDKARKRLLIRLGNLLPADMAEEPNKIYHPPMNGSENATTEIMESRVGINKSEEKKNLAETEEILSRIKGAGAEQEFELKKLKAEEHLLAIKTKFEEDTLKLKKEEMEIKLNYERKRTKIMEQQAKHKKAASSSS